MKIALHTERRLRSGAIAGVDADVFRGEVAGPVAGAFAAGVQIHDDGDVVGEQAIAGGALVEVERLAAAEDVDAGHEDVDARSVEGHTGAAGGSEDAAPVGIASSEGGFHERGSRDCLRDLTRTGFGFCATHYDFDHAL